MKTAYSITEIGEVFDMSVSHLKYHLTKNRHIVPTKVGKRKFYSASDVMQIAAYFLTQFGSAHRNRLMAEKFLGTLVVA